MNSSLEFGPKTVRTYRGLPGICTDVVSAGTGYSINFRGDHGKWWRTKIRNLGVWCEWQV